MNDLLFHPPSLEVGGRVLGGAEPFFILGPCALESRELALETAAEIAAMSKSLDVRVVFKSSYDKANRTSVDSFRGPGLEKGLEILAEVRETTGLPVISDIHAPQQAPIAAQVLDIIQIPAFLSRQTDLLVAAGKTGKPINIKKGQFLSPADMIHAIRKVLSTGNSQILLTERGSTFGYQDLVADMRSIVRMKHFGFPVVFDATHSAQLPGRGEGSSGGDRTLVPPLARAAMAAGADGVFMEVHPDPERALCDGPNSLRLSDVKDLVGNLCAIFKLVPRVEKTGLDSSPVPEECGPPEATLEERVKKIRLLIFDVDGVLTDGRIVFGSEGLEIKSFHVRDGHGIKIAKRCDLEMAVVTGRTSDVVQRRAEELGITRIFQRVLDKRPVLIQLLGELNLQPEAVAVIGDDVVDIPLFRRVGLGVTVPEAPAEVRQAAHYVTRHPGGDGAAREVVEMILKVQGKWDGALARYYE